MHNAYFRSHNLLSLNLLIFPTLFPKRIEIFFFILLSNNMFFITIVIDKSSSGLIKGVSAHYCTNLINQSIRYTSDVEKIINKINNSTLTTSKYQNIMLLNSRCFNWDAKNNKKTNPKIKWNMPLNCYESKYKIERFVQLFSILKIQEMWRLRKNVCF